jgi:hypothetical protein
VIPTAAIIAECARRGYSKTETIAILTLALDQAWSVIDPLALNRYETARDGPHSPWPDACYCIAASRGLPATLWQAFKDTLYQHIDQAATLYANPTIEEDDLSALSDEEQRELLTKVRVIYADAHDTRIQLRGPGDAGWPQLGQNAQKQNLSFVDAIAAIKKKVLG